MFFLSVNPDLFVRSLMESDLNDLFDLLVRNRVKTNKFVQLDSADSVACLRNSLRQYDDAFTDGRGLFLGVFVEKQLQGEIRFEFKTIDRDSTSCVCNIAYWVDPVVRGRYIVYDCLRTILPVINRMEWLNNSRIGRFDATIERTNRASQNIVDRLGFRKSLSSDSLLDILLDQIAPRAIQEWSLTSSQLDDPGFFHLSNADYLSRASFKASGCEPSESIRSTRLSIFSSLFDVLSDPHSEVPDTASYSILVSLQHSISHIVEQIAPDRVVTTNMVSYCSPIKLDHFRGIWRDPQSLDSLIIVYGNFCVKGYEQSWDSRIIAGLTISGVHESIMSLDDGNITQTWERISCGDKGQVDGIWKTSRGVVGVYSSTYVSSSSIWEIQPDPLSGRWTLAIGDQWFFHLDSTTFNEILWATTTDTTIMKRSSRKRGNTGPMRWHRDLAGVLNPETATFINDFTWYLRNREIQACIALRKLQIAILLKCGTSERKLLKRFQALVIRESDVDELLHELESQLMNLEQSSASLNFWFLLSRDLQSVPFSRLSDILSAKLESELDP